MEAAALRRTAEVGRSSPIPTAMCDGPGASARVLDLRVVVQAGRSLVDEVQ
jgi:hypothetical protein